MGAARLEVFAPAKLNLFLHVVGRRADGYHLLQSVFRLLDWGDRITLTVRDDGQIIRSSDLAGVPAERDLCVRAARLLQQSCASPLGVEIAVDKRLPMGGGLGGGSSDAASVLMGLNRLWACGLGCEALQALGVQLGADVPFFIFGRDAFVEGIGETMQAISLPPAWYVVLWPAVEVPTAEIFCDEGLTRDTPLTKIADFAQSTTRNDLQVVAQRKYPAVKAALEWLEQFSPARMTGSGACVFAEVSGADEALRIVSSCPPTWRAWAAQSLSAHPDADWSCVCAEK